MDQKNYFLKHDFVGKGLNSPHDGHAGLIIICGRNICFISIIITIELLLIIINDDFETNKLRNREILLKKKEKVMIEKSAFS